MRNRNDETSPTQDAEEEKNRKKRRNKRRRGGRWRKTTRRRRDEPPGNSLVHFVWSCQSNQTRSHRGASRPRPLRRMDKRGSSGSPRAASSDSLPAFTNEESVHQRDWISASEEDGRQRTELGGPPCSQNQSPVETHQTSVETHQSRVETDQSPVETHQSPVETHQSPVETHQSPVETHQSPVETHQSPVETHQSPVETHQSPVETHQSPVETHQSPVETHQSTIHRSPVETHRSPVETHQSPVETHQSPVETHQSPVETHQSTIHRSPVETHRSPVETHQSPVETHQSPVETHQSTIHRSPVETHQSPVETHQSSLKTHQYHEETLQIPNVPPQDPGHTQIDKPDLVDLIKCTNNKDDPSEPDQLKPDPLLTDEQKLVRSPSSKMQETKDQPGRPGELDHHEQVGSEEHQPLRNPIDQKNQEPPTENPSSNPSERLQIHRDLPQLQLQEDQPAPPQAAPSIVHPTETCTTAPPSQAPPRNTEWLSEQVWPHPLVSPSGEPKLCGFLQKQGGPLRTWKLRWFTYEGKNNQLFYYRTPQDVIPLGRVELRSSTLTYPLKAERGTFHIKTPERTFVLKAVTQELMLYWLQQLQVKRWQHRQTSTCPDPTNKNATENFLPMLKSPLGLVGEEAANVSLQGSPLTNVSIKHPLIEIQNSVHSLRKRPSQEWSQSVFHVEAPPWSPADSSSAAVPPSPRTPADCPTPPPPLSLAEAPASPSPSEGRESPSLFESRSRKLKARSMQVLRRDTLSSSSDRTSRLQQEKQMLMEEVKAQKELVWILHKALEASQLEKRTCAEFLAETGEQERLELLRHRERQAVDLRSRLEEAKMEGDALSRSLSQKDAQVTELQEEVRTLTETNRAKQEVIIKLSDHVNTFLSDHQRSVSSSQTYKQLQQDIEDLKDDIEAYKTQNKFLNSEIYQLTKLWRNSSEQEKNLMVKCAYLEANNCQVESRYLGVLRQLQDTKSLDPSQRKAVQKLIEDALKGEVKSVVKLNMASDRDEYGFKIIPDYEVEDMKLLAKIQALEIRSHNLLHQDSMERPLLSRWAQYLAGRSDDNLCPSPELKSLLRGGIPQEYRQQVWSWMVRTRTKAIRELHPQRYQQLCETSRTSPHPASRQIELDLHRTLTTNQHFCSPSSPALQQLRRILLAFSWQNPTIGYCQGLNRVKKKRSGVWWLWWRSSCLRTTTPRA
ncbi:TBC1 domain family member 2A isoform X2 [Antennarius striatus]|uniref:TBC1 domain family member 2A isoform X2 n=1 Tax=Antennarius striatus TaxID=241820 RepID=UPI0035AF71CB